MDKAITLQQAIFDSKRPDNTNYIQTVLFHPFQPFERQIFSWTTEEAIAIRQVGYSHLDEVAETEVTSFAEHFGYQLT